MPKSKTSSFIHELRLVLTPKQESILNTRLNVARQIYNACLGEGIRRLKLMRESKDWQRPCKMPKDIKNAKGCNIANKARQELFKSAREKYEFSEYDIHKYTTYLRQSKNLSDHVDSATTQKLGSRAFDALMKYVIGKRGKPRFKSHSRFSSVD
jgi:putative transposase